MGSWELLSLVFKQPPLPMVIYPTCGNVRATGEGENTYFGLTFGDHSVENVFQFVGCDFHVLRQRPERRRRQ